MWQFRQELITSNQRAASATVDHQVNYATGSVNLLKAIKGCQINQMYVYNFTSQRRAAVGDICCGQTSAVVACVIPQHSSCWRHPLHPIQDQWVDQMRGLILGAVPHSRQRHKLLQAGGQAGRQMEGRVGGWVGGQEGNAGWAAAAEAAAQAHTRQQPQQQHIPAPSTRYTRLATQNHLD
jgi:hypothetical protein